MKTAIYTYSTNNDKDIFQCFVNPTIVNGYYKNNAKKLHNIVDKLLLNFGGIENKDKDAFYSLANEVFFDVMNRYDGKQSFEGFIYSCLDKKIKTEMTRRNRQKRQADRKSVSWETPLNDESDTTIGNMIEDTKRATHYDIDKTFFNDDGEKYSEKMLKYISKLSNLQKEVVKLLIAGYTANEIKGLLHISNREYTDSIAAIRSYRNISILF